MIPYLLHAAILLSIFWVFYWMFIRKETYYKLNRFFLVSVIALSILLPLFTIPESLSLRSEKLRVDNNTTLEIPVNTTTEDVLIPIDNSTQVLENNTIAQAETSLPFWSNWNLENILWITYLAGGGVFLLTFLIQFILLFYRKSQLEYVQDDQYRIYELTDDQAPFSFLTWIFINPTKYDFDTYEQILEHEKVHVSQYHFLDKFLAEFLVIVFWFNPFAWLYRKSITNNIEFLTDFEMLGKGVEKEIYQYSLLKVSVPQYAMNLTTSYNESFLKERIIMMNTKKSSAKSSWKYLLILPLAILCMASLNAVNYSAQNAVTLSESQTMSDEKTPTEVLSVREEKNEKIDIPSVESNAPKEEIDKQLEAESQPEKVAQQIVVEHKDKVKNKSKTNKIKTIQLEEGKPGFWKASIEGDKVCLALNFMMSSNYQQHQCFSRSEFTNVSENSEGIFVLERDAGKLVLKGEFEDGLGEGRFDFESNPEFEKFLNIQGYVGADESDMLQLFMSDISRGFIESAKGNIKGLSLSKLIELGIHTNGESDIEELMKICKKIGHDNPSAKELIEMAIHGVTEEFVDGLLQVSSTDLTLKRVVEAKIHNVDPSFVKSLKENGYPNISLKRVIEMAIHGVDQNDVEALSAAGYKDIDPKYLVEFAIHGIDADYINALSGLGLSDLKPREIVEFAIHNVSANYIQAMRDAGYENISANKLVESKIHNVNPEDGAEYRRLGLDVSINKLIEFNIHNVSPTYVADLQKLGLSGLSPSQVVEGKIHSVSPERIREYQELGVTGLTWRKIVAAKIHGVSPKFIKKARDSGYNPKDLGEYTELKIMGIK